MRWSFPDEMLFPGRFEAKLARTAMELQHCVPIFVTIFPLFDKNYSTPLKRIEICL
jgi:hypothetical protein